MLSIDDVRSALRLHRVVDHPALPGRRNHLDAGVLVPLQWRSDGVDVLLTLRTATLSLHAGEVSFPGGRPDPGDDGLEATALREAREELGISDVDVLGPLCSMPVYTSDYRLHPFVAAVHDTTLRPQPTEVAEVLRFDVARWVQPGAIEGIPYTVKGMDGLSPLFRAGARLVFGATAHTLFELLEVLAPSLTGRPLPQPTISALGWQDVIDWVDSGAGTPTPRPRTE
jgi:8-oxo-dGTP pyrophosphatase MutT (NUDIX family)